MKKLCKRMQNVLKCPGEILSTFNPDKFKFVNFQQNINKITSGAYNISSTDRIVRREGSSMRK